MKSLLLTILTFHAACSFSQPSLLPRRPLIGLRTDSLTRDQKDKHHIDEGVMILSVLPGSTASDAGLQPGDILLSINKTGISSPQALLTLAAQSKTGDILQFRIRRGTKNIAVKGEMKSYPREQYKDLDVEYSFVTVNGVRLRTIVTQPKAKQPLPAILYIQGMSCSTIDHALDTTAAVTQLVNTLARSGFVVMRVEKAGIGDSEGGPCAGLDFNIESEGYRAGLESLSDRPNVKKNETYIFGHSMGGVFAPLIAGDLPVKGIIAYGTIATNYLEYIINSRRQVAAAIGLGADQTDTFVRDYASCYGLYFSLNRNSRETLSLRPDCEDELLISTIRNEKYLEQLYYLNIPSLWKTYDGRVLALSGDSDFVSLASDHRLIADIVNENHPGNGTYMSVPDTEHGMATAFSYHQAARNPGPFNKKVAALVVDWIRGRESTSTAARPQELEFPDDPTSVELIRMENIENAYPRWGKNSTIIFQSNRDGHWQIYAMDKHGNQRNISNNAYNDNYVSVSSDGELIGFVSDRDGNEEIYTMNDDGTDVTRLTNHAARDIHPYFSPDGKKIFFNSTRDGGTNFEVYSIALNGGDLQRLTETPDEETCARVSPDGRKIVLLAGVLSVMNDEILIMDRDGRNRVNLTRSPVAEGWPVWSPDGSKIYYASGLNGTFCIFRMNADGTDKKQITKVDPPFMDARPEISPDGKKLLFNRQVMGRNGKNTIAIYSKDLGTE